MNVSDYSFIRPKLTETNCLRTVVIKGMDKR